MPERTPIVSRSAAKAVTTKTAIGAFTMQRLWRQALWGCGAAAALLVAVLASRSDTGSQRVAVVLASLNAGSSAGQPGTTVIAQTTPRTPEADATTRQIVQAIRGLAEDRDRMTKRLAAVERNMDDMTGSITRQIEAARATKGSAPSWPVDEPSVPMTAATITPFVTSFAPSPSTIASLPAATPSMVAEPTAEAESSEPSGAVASAPLAPIPPTAPAAYGIDIGGGASIKALQVRWAALHSAYPQLFEGLRPVVALKDTLRSNRVDLRLMVGPIANAARAAELCASLAAARVACRPTMFEGRHLALQ